MAKKTITAPTYDVDNNQQQDRKPTMDYVAFQTLLDKVGKDGRDYLINDLIAELQSVISNQSGSFTIGHNTIGITADNVGDALIEIKDALDGIVLGQIPDNTLTEAKMAAEMKKQPGGVAEFDTVATDVVNLDILRIAETDTGAADAYVVDTPGTFSRVDGNTFSFIPSNNNTGASTINEDTTGAASIKKYVDGAWVDLEEGDIKKFQKVDLTWNASESAFTLAPKSGAVIKSIQRGSGSMSTSSTSVNIPISQVDLTKSIIRVTLRGSQTQPARLFVAGKFNSDIELNFQRVVGTGVAVFEWEVVEFNNVKSMQSGTKTSVETATTITQAISSVDTSKSLLFFSFKSTADSSTVTGAWLMTAKITSDVLLTWQRYASVGSGTTTIEWFVVEFN